MKRTLQSVKCTFPSNPSATRATGFIYVQSANQQLLRFNRGSSPFFLKCLHNTVCEIPRGVSGMKPTATDGNKIKNTCQ